MAETITHHHPSCPARTDPRADCLGCPTPPAVPARGSMRDQSFTARWDAARVLNANGWTLDAAMNHLEGSCDRLLCCGWPAELCDSCHQRPSGHGHFGLYCQPCSELPYGVSAP